MLGDLKESFKQLIKIGYHELCGPLARRRMIKINVTKFAIIG
jgi:hypothetical protein